MTYHIPDGLPALRSGAGGSPSNGGCIIEVASYLWDGSWTDAAECVHPVLRRAAIRVNDALGNEERQKLWPLIPRLVGTASDDKRLAVSLAIFSAEYVFDRVREQDRKVCRRAIDAAKAWVEAPSKESVANAANAAAAHASNYAAYASNYAAFAATTAAYAAADASAAYAAAATANAAYAAVNAAAYAANAANAATAATAYAAHAANAATAATAYAAAALTFLTDLLDEYDCLTGRTPEPIQADRWEALAEVFV